MEGVAESRVNNHRVPTHFCGGPRGLNLSQVSPTAIVRVLVRGSNYGTNKSGTVTTSCNPKDS